MRDFEFISVPQIAAVHHEAMKVYGVPSRMRDPALLKSAVALAQSVYTEGHGDLFEVAAAYAYHIVQNQPFVSGNKAIALLAALTLLKINGCVWQFEEAVILDAVNAIAEKRMEIAGLAAILRTAAGADNEPRFHERRDSRHRYRD